MASLILEACVETLDEALAAQQNGATRIELCADLAQDGLTPEKELTLACLKNLSIPIMAMVRPRGGNFVYSEPELKEMEESIRMFKQLGVAGVVFGLLKEDHTVDLENTRRLAALAKPLEVTFHKAIDYSADPLVSFQQLNEVDGITRVLTSGGAATALEGQHIIRRMNNLPGRKISVIAAGKITALNRDQIAQLTGSKELHGKKIVGKLT
jgi:copper homeostasis protein